MAKISTVATDIGVKKIPQIKKKNLTKLKKSDIICGGLFHSPPNNHIF